MCFFDGPRVRLPEYESGLQISLLEQVLLFKHVWTVAYVFFAIAVIALLLRRSEGFPLSFMAFLLTGVAYYLVDICFECLVFPDKPLVESATIGRLVRQIVLTLVWIPYLTRKEQCREKPRPSPGPYSLSTEEIKILNPWGD